MEYASSRLSSQFNSLQLLQEVAAQGVWEKLNHTLRGQVRSKLGKSTQPTALAKLAAGIAADSQSVKTAEKRGMCTALMGVKR